MTLDARAPAARPYSGLILPDPPTGVTGPVKAWREPVDILTYPPEAPGPHPMFLERRVYQGSSGRVYPLPFFDRISIDPEVRSWDAIHIENEYLRLMILPGIGGRIHIGFDKISGYDFFYRQNVIKPALVGLAGPWISGGVEFNWPQHHRPATFMPVETEIEHHPDGSITVWCSDHDPMLRMKGMHGVCLRPGSAAVEVKVRLYNRTQLTQTFLWWANVATRVHEQYQSFFPTDVRFVADHAKRAITAFPLADRPYYGVDYPGRAQHGVPEDELPPCFRPDGSYPANDLSWYANIPVPTSYMITRTADDFFGGYDHRARAGVVHVANHHIAPGKKQWTWGNHEFGYAWDRSLTDSDGPYIELMAGVYTDNQPDFSFLAPWETKTFIQTWYPIRGTGVPQAATTEAALHLEVRDVRAALNLNVTRSVSNATIELHAGGHPIHSWTEDLTVPSTFSRTIDLPAGTDPATLSAIVRTGDRTILNYDPAAIEPAEAPTVAKEPLPPEQIDSIEELYLTGLHLDQYRHATRRPETYWREALRRDPDESRCRNALGLWHLRRGELRPAADHFERAIQRLTRLNPNPYDGEPYYNLGIALRYLGDDSRAYDALYKSTWNSAWRAPAYFALAEIDVKRQHWTAAKDHLQRSVRADADNLNARNLLAFVHRQLGETAAAENLVAESLALDPLDIGARHLTGTRPADAQQTLDLAFDLLRAGRDAEALTLLRAADLTGDDGSAPILLLTLADVESRLNDPAAPETLRRANTLSPDRCFPSRLEELLVLERTLARNPDSALASYLLGNLLYDRRRQHEAIAHWQTAAALEPAWPTVHRNLGIAYFNIAHNPQGALEAFDRAFAADSSDARIFYERDQLWKRIGRDPQTRLDTLLAHPSLVARRDDLTVELATLYNQLHRPAEALALLLHRHFQPWEGGEGLVLAQYVRGQLLLGKAALEQDPAAALQHFEAALHPPQNLGEARHLLANQSDVFFWIARAHEALDHNDESRAWFLRATRYKGDFQQMSVRDVSDMTYWSALALEQLGHTSEARQTFRRILTYSHQLAVTPPKIDYFATSLPAMLLFDDDLGLRNRIDSGFLRAQALFGLGDRDDAEQLLHDILALDANHSGAQDLLAHLHTKVRKAAHS